MSHKSRRTLAIASVIAASFLVLPAPSQAAGLWPFEPTDLAARVWTWIESFRGGHGLAPQPHQSSFRLEKEGSGINPDGLSQVGAKQGSLVDPDGHPGATPTSSSTNTDQGSMVDPDGKP